MPPKKTEVNYLFHDLILNYSKCTFPNCQVTFKRKSNLKRHTKNCENQKKRKVHKNACPYCKTTFSQKYNRDGHVKNVDQEDD